MNRITRCFQQLKQENRKALVTYIINGDPTLSATLPTMQQLVANGADILEIGIAFSDPMADGPSIQPGHERALASGATLRSTLAVVKEFRQNNQHTPVVLMGYENPIERMGYQHFATAAAEAGVDGLIVVDLPPEEATELNTVLKDVGIENIFLLAPTTTEARAKQIISMAGGFLYYVSLKGVTGAGNLDVNAVNEKLAQFRRLTDLPICVGFGIKNADSARAVTQQADGAVLGSVFVEKMGQLKDRSDAEIAKSVGEMIVPIRAAMNAS